MNEANTQTTTTNEATITLKDTAKAFIDHLKEMGKKERTLYTYRKDLDLIEGFFGSDKELDAIRPHHIGKFFKSDALLKRSNGEPRAERTIAKTIRVFRMMMIWAKDTGKLDELQLPKSTPMGRDKKRMEASDANTGQPA